METLLTAVIGVPVAVLIGLAALLFYLLRTERQLVDRNGNVVPGPPTAVVAGNIAHFSEYHKELRLSEGIVELQKKFHAHPYMSIIFPGARMIVCGCPEAAKAVLSGSHTNFPKSPKYEAMECVLGLGLVTSNGDLWKQHRSLMSPAFHADNLKPMVDSFSRHAEEMSSIWLSRLQSLQAKGERAQFPIDFHHAMTALTGDIICDVGFGYQLDAKKDLNFELFQALEIALKEMVLRFQEPFKFTRYLPTARNRKFAWAMKALSKVIDSIIHQRLAEADQIRAGAMQPPERRTDLLDLMMAAKDSETGAKFTDAGIRDEVFTFLGAGHETTANMLSWTLYELGHHPEIVARIQQELDSVLQGRAPSYSDINSLDYLNMVIKESLRLHPPVSAIARDAPKGLDLPASKCFESSIGVAKNRSAQGNGESDEDAKDSIAYSFTAEQDVRLMVPIYVLHRDPHSWEQPEEFVPERWSPELTPFKDSEKEKHRHPFAYVPFSAGPRSCIGQRFALLEGAAILAVLLQRFDITLQSKDRIAPEETITVRPRGGVHVTVSLRQK